MTVAERLVEVRQRIESAGGDPDAVTVVAVTKGFGPAEVDQAVAAGLVDLGENYAQELVAKFGHQSFGMVVHFIGQLQSNKVRQIVDLVDVYETVDRPALVVELAKRAHGAHVLVQVDTTDEAGKGGCAPSDVVALVNQSTAAGLVVDGLMTVGPTSGGQEAARAGFRLVRGLCNDLGLATCSMGMSDDFVVAVEEGSTQVRLGSALFGMRPATSPRVR
jgi:PLP dependent protein